MGYVLWQGKLKLVSFFNRPTQLKHDHSVQTSPYHLLSGEFGGTFDDGFQTCPIVPFDETVRNAWDNQKVEFDDHRRHIKPMPPLSSITIGQPDWLIQEAERRRQLEEQEQARRRQEEQRRQEEERRRREEDERSREAQQKVY